MFKVGDRVRIHPDYYMYGHQAVQGEAEVRAIAPRPSVSSLNVPILDILLVFDNEHELLHKGMSLYARPSNQLGEHRRSWWVGQEDIELATPLKQEEQVPWWESTDKDDRS